MTTAEYLDDWRARGLLTGEQHAAISAITRSEPFSVFGELNALLYIGVVSIVAGIGWTVYTHFAHFSDALIVSVLAAVFASCLYFCFTRSAAAFAFDYVLYLGCLIFAVELGYVEFRFQLLRDNRDYYLLASAVLYFVLAYRFNNRLVLSLALSTLAGWFGLRLSLLGLHIAGSLRGDALAYAALLSGAASWTHRTRPDTRFVETYLHVAVNMALAAMVSGTASGDLRVVWLAALLGVSAVTVERGIHFKRFTFVAYGVVYAYLGATVMVLRDSHSLTFALAYLMLSATGLVMALAALSRRVARGK